MNKPFWDNLIQQLGDFLYNLGTKAVYAAIALVIGVFIIKLLKKLILKIMDKHGTERSIRAFVTSLTSFVLYALLLYVLGRIIGVKASSFIAIFGAIGVAIGLGLQGSLANFAGGLLILVFKPFRVGDEVEINNIQGEVVDINILYTRISDWRGEIYTLPNGNVANSAVKNNSAEPYRRIQVELHFSHDEDFDRLREIITTTMKKTPLVDQDRPFQLWINNFQPYYIKTSARCWCKSEEYWGVYWEIEERIKKALAENDIQLAIPKQIIYQPDNK